MSAIAAAVRHMLAAGMAHDAIVAAVEAMEAAATPAPRSRSAAAERMARYRAKRRETGLDPNFHGAMHRPALIERDGPLCIYCQEADGAAVDHMVPIAQGGTDHEDNLALSCSACNGGKSGRTPEQWGREIKSPTARAAHVRYVRSVSEHVRDVGEQVNAEVASRVVYTKLPTEVVINPLTSPSETTPAKPKSPNGSRLPDDWEPDLEAALAVGLGRDAALQQADRFRDYWRGVPGAKGRKADWPATWRNWCRKSAEFNPRGPNDGQRPDPKRIAREANLARAFAGSHAASRFRSG